MDTSNPKNLDFRSVRGLSLEGLVLLLRATCYSLVQRCSHLGQDDSKAFIMIVVVVPCRRDSPDDDCVACTVIQIFRRELTTGQ